MTCNLVTTLAYVRTVETFHAHFHDWHWWLVRDGIGTIVAFASVYPWHYGMFISNLTVAAQQRRQGLATRLLTTIYRTRALFDDRP
jgi:predicted GNAT family acetyltransferase